VDHRVVIKRIVLAGAVLALAACSGSATVTATVTVTAGAGSGHPSAMALAQKIAGVTGCGQSTPDVESTGDVICSLSDGSQVELATFATQSAEMQWIQNGGTGSPPDPAYAGCCIQGNLWAATVSAPDYVDSGSTAVIAALGGRVVNG
jgi:hypothetical protein